ncbi:unnamed protein product [Protopolystoma xenopodis]|uniref:Uncharacterized protein n=1 Tax=Protopolystoma xenopodis TaxID=117903 RepID=A0A448WY98_9PLAT|nr:unnamed protein product [Protopolystoma xenopodis]
MSIAKPMSCGEKEQMRPRGITQKWGGSETEPGSKTAWFMIAVIQTVLAAVTTMTKCVPDAGDGFDGSKSLGNCRLDARETAKCDLDFGLGEPQALDRGPQSQ